ncbi:MAG: metal ABC transporter ATP-binding protein [Arcanobacterium sp.]
MSAIRTESLSVQYQRHIALKPLTVNIPAHQITAIVGPNGSGKSTALKAMLGLIPASGRTYFKAKVGYMPQHSSVDWTFPTTVKDVVLMGTYGSLGWFRRPGRAEKERAARAAEQTGVSELADRQIGALSGGQRQRVFLARTLAQAPDIYMMDEPFAGIDTASEAAIMRVLTEDLAGKTRVIVHHDLETVRAVSDNVILLSDGQLVAAGPTEQALTRENLQLAYHIPVG